MKLSKALKNMDMLLLILSAILLIFGLLNIVSASSQAAVLKYKSNLYSYFYRQAGTIIVGIIISLLIIKTPSKSYKILGPAFYIGVLILSLMVSFSSFGASYSGNNNWIYIPKLGTIQPSEFAKIALIVFEAMLFEKYHKELSSDTISSQEKWNAIGRVLIVGIIFPFIIFMQHDMGTMLIIAAIFGVLLLTSPISKDYKKTAIIVVLVASLISGFVILNKGSGLSDRQSSRLDFFNPCKNYEDGGYQICNGFIAINSGGIFGNGIGNTKQISYIPESHTDSVFAIIAEQYGLIITTIIFIIYALLLKSILNISARSKTIRGRYICLGIAVYIFLHILVNLGGLFGIMPLTGVPLPFLSYGGSFTITLICAIALVQRIEIENRTMKN